MKIRIIGCSGSGKTYFAKLLSEKYNIPSFDLDNIFWDNDTNQYGIKMPVDKRNQLLVDILQQPDWIIEGVYYAWCKKTFDVADRIYVLDIPKRIYKFRIIKRFLQRKLGLIKGKKETVKSVCNLLKWTETFQKINMKEIKGILEEHNCKVVYIKKPSDINKILDNIDIVIQYNQCS